MFILLIFSCGGDAPTNYNGVIIETKSKFQNYKNKEIIIYSNISEFAIEEFKNNQFVSYESIQSFSNETKCKDINPNYIKIKESSRYLSSRYSYNDFIACYYFDMSKTTYSGNKTYIVAVSDLYQHVNEDRPPNFNSNFNALFAKPKINIELPFALKDYNISEIEKNNNYLIIYRDASEQFLLDVLKPMKSPSIYKLPKNKTITCEKLGFSYKDYLKEPALKRYQKEYMKNNEKRYKTCIDYSVQSHNDSRYYGNDTYIGGSR